MRPDGRARRHGSTAFVRSVRYWAGVIGPVMAALLCTTPSFAEAPAPYDWPQFNGGPRHSGNNTLEHLISARNVSKLTLLFKVNVPSTIDGAVTALSRVKTLTGTVDLLLATTKAGHLLALDAHSGATIWTRQVGPGSCRFFEQPLSCFTNSSPAIDPNRQFVYSYGLDGRVHKYRVDDGSEVVGGGWPEVTTLRLTNEKASSALSVARTMSGDRYLYVVHAGTGPDVGVYQGHLTTINLATGAQHVFNTMCSNHSDVHFTGPLGPATCPQNYGGIWGRSGVIYDRDTDRIYMAVGNGTFDPVNHEWGDSVLALNPDGTGRANGDPLDSYTPRNHAELLKFDFDLGSSSPVVLPVPPRSRIKHLALQTGKDGKLRLIDLTNMSGQGGPGHTGGEVSPIIDVPQGGPVFSVPATWLNPADGSTWVYVANYSGIAGLRLLFNAHGTPYLHPVWTRQDGGSSPLVANGVVYEAGDNRLQALDPLTGKRLWQDTRIHNIHWSSPVVANGILYISDWQENHFSRLLAYALPGVAAGSRP